ncbi:MAG: AraC family transcriptional regulator, partial [Marinilabiliales bacterium]
FSVSTNNHEKLFKAFTIGETSESVVARNGLKVTPDYTIHNHPKMDILIIPGGYGAEQIEINNDVVLRWIKDQELKVDFLASVCTGAFLLAETGILDYKKATTHWMDLERLENEYPNINVIRNVKFVDEGRILTSGGISAVINMSFYIIENLFGIEGVKETAKIMEYDLP